LKKRELPIGVYVPEVDGWAPDTRDELREILTILQDWKCPVCQDGLGGILDVHEGIVTKGDVQGWPDSWKFLINNIYNCSYIHRHCHRHGEKEFYWHIKCQMFGEDSIKRWYYNLPFKNGVPRRFE